MRNDLTVPNVVTAARIVMALVAAVLAWAGAQALAVAILIAAALLDVFDGWYARNFSQCSGLGAHLDPFADKILMGVTYAWIGIETASPPVWTMIGLVAVRETAVTVLRWQSLRRRRRFIPASGLGRIKMLMQSMVGLTLLSVMHFLRRGVPEPVVVAGVAAILTMSYLSAVGYFRRWRQDARGPAVEEAASSRTTEPGWRASAGR
ncbi:MAG TPA: CDP-alcohol phosphatidyltransferase family protein [Candidatus Krumholzibacteria bacterium]|nr:CDP-alcohol phosphatidyltransferase family protein [Candidatus Krumholzibacteria bacterium]